jgi:hypothetical protein
MEKKGLLVILQRVALFPTIVKMRIERSPFTAHLRNISDFETIPPCVEKGNPANTLLPLLPPM